MGTESVRYRTIGKMGSGVYRDKGSRFLGFAMSVSGVEDAMRMVREYRKEYGDARHVCWAYVTDEGERWVDDGEPNGTAGVMIGGVLRSSGLENVLCVVVRYFGGTLLGVGGLRTAYKESARLAVEDSEKVERTRTERRVVEASAADAARMLKRVYELKERGAVRVISEVWGEDGGVKWELDVERGQ